MVLVIEAEVIAELPPDYQLFQEGLLGSFGGAGPLYLQCHPLRGYASAVQRRRKAGLAVTEGVVAIFRIMLQPMVDECPKRLIPRLPPGPYLHLLHCAVYVQRP